MQSEQAANSIIVTQLAMRGLNALFASHQTVLCRGSTPCVIKITTELQQVTCLYLTTIGWKYNRAPLVWGMRKRFKISWVSWPCLLVLTRLAGLNFPKP